jgi:formylglycine-generating enzyme
MRRLTINTIFCLILLAVMTPVIAQETSKEREKSMKSEADSFSASIEMVLVRGGTFTMGCTADQSDCKDDEKPTHQVTLSDFYIGKYEVTQKQWRDVMGTKPYSLKEGCDNCAVESVSWNDIQEFIRKLNQRTGKTYRLPTEAEWEYAARGGNLSKGYKYPGGSTIDEVAWYYLNMDANIHPVGLKKANELGIFDMGGNVWECCSDWFGAYTANRQTNPKGVSSGSYRVLRGGSWLFPGGCCRASFRAMVAPDTQTLANGFRLAQDY